MAPEEPFIRVEPGEAEPGNATEAPWVIVLSDWKSQGARLVGLVNKVTSGSADATELPTVLVVDDRPSPQTEGQTILDELVEAGAILLEPEGDRWSDPIAFARAQCQAAAGFRQPGGPGTLSAEPADPEGYKEFGQAVTRLSAEDLDAVINGKRPDGPWRSEIG
jgi:hypothetical protein